MAAHGDPITKEMLRFIYQREGRICFFKHIPYSLCYILDIIEALTSSDITLDSFCTHTDVYTLLPWI